MDTVSLSHSHIANLMRQNRLATMTSGVVIACILFFSFTGFILSKGIDISHKQSSIYDLDVRSAVKDATKKRRGDELGKHPLYRAIVYPFGRRINKIFFHGDDNLNSVRILSVLVMSMTVAASGLLAWQLSNQSYLAMLVTSALSASSFSSILLASVPDSASFSGITSILPLLYLYKKRFQDVGFRESVFWGVLMAVGFGLTVTQIMPALIAFSIRMWTCRSLMTFHNRLKHVSITLTVFLLSVTIGVAVILHRDPDSYIVHPREMVASEKRFVRYGAKPASALAHATRYLYQIFITNQVAPMPVTSNYLIDNFGLDYEILSSEETTFDDWLMWQRALAVMWLFVFPICIYRRNFTPPMIASAIVCVFHFSLHFIYGREYVGTSENRRGLSE